ncbi:MAG TPA: flagellar biosynthesis protein FlhB [Candidatus Tenderia sp.]|nr:flagellar biosynthesis protein FlhB [Candidatus Tenderia sp.]
MAEDSGQERSEEPTEKKLRESREKGQMARSRELTTTVMLMSAAACLLLFGAGIVEGLMEVMVNALSMERAKVFDTRYMVPLFLESVAQGMWILMPLFVVLVIAAVVGSVALSGWNFSTKALAVKMSKLDPLKGMKKILGPQALMELVKAVLKFVFFVGVGIWLMSSVSSSLMGLAREPLPSALAHAGDVVLWSFLAVSSTMILISLLDAPFQVWNHKRQLKMTRQDVKQEHKDTDGSPELKQKIRQTQMNMSQRRMMEDVPDADVIITNPTHFAVAIKYDQGDMRAPIVVAKGADYVAFEIRRVAKESNVTILSSPSLARAVYFTTELNQEIPEGLYVAVAQVLAYVFQLRKLGPAGVNKPLNPDDLPIPDEMRRDAEGNNEHPKR